LVTRSQGGSDASGRFAVAALRETLPQSPGSVVPYCGDRPYEHCGANGGPHSLKIYASDRSGTKTYFFNAAGFRGDSLDANAAFRVFVCGASYAFGTGLDWEETFAYRLKTELAPGLGLSPEQINVLNFSQSLASAGYVTRTLLSQCEANRPNLIIANYSDMGRSEFFLDGAPVGVVPQGFSWLRRWRALRPGWRQRLFRMLPGVRDRKTADRRLRMWDDYSRLYSSEAGVANTLTQMLLLQSFCQARGLDCLMSWVQHKALSEPRIRSNPALAPLIALLDPQHYCSFSIVDPGICTDLAADGVHPGPSSNQLFAEQLARAYLENRSRAARHSRRPLDAVVTTRPHR
jgi:hypothetical protein